MAVLAPLPIGVLARRMFRELDAKQAIFDLPARSFADLGARDTSVRFHGRPAASPFGPAAGPHTQLAQNIVLAWLAGGRVIELKTVQINDRLTIPRPCIDMQTVGYNVEWSQELTLEESLEEYVKAAMLIRMLDASGLLPPAPGDTVFDMSVGYDLAGIRSDRVVAFMRGLQDATPVIERLRHDLPADLGPLRDLDFAPRVSGTLTLSTFHGCPPDEIERIVRFLLGDMGLDCVVKLNPTLLGEREVYALLHDALGFTDLRIPGDAFERDTKWDDAVGFVDRLADTARSLGRGFGVKCTNTLIVENHRTVFPADERAMYLSGAPLHVLAIHLVRRLRHAFGARVPISFSAGVDRHNFADAVALGLVPVTACTDLLRTGGYARPRRYLEELGRRMDAVGAGTVDEFVVRAYGSGAADPDAALRHNIDVYAERATADPRYAAPAHRKGPRKIGRMLRLFDCLTCDKCIPVCPNDAVFTFAMASTPEVPLTESRQIAVVADLCNDCGNCDTFCPEDGGPYVMKPRFFTDRARWLADAPRDAVLIEPHGASGRFGGEVVHLVAGRADPPDSPHAIVLRQLLESVLAPSEINHLTAFPGTP